MRIGTRILGEVERKARIVVVVYARCYASVGARLEELWYQLAGLREWKVPVPARMPVTGEEPASKVPFVLLVSQSHMQSIQVQVCW